MWPMLLLAFSTSADPAEIDADQFQRSIRAAISDIKDVTFVYEGERRYVGPAGAVVGAHERTHETYQGTYRFRSDGATLWDYYQRFVGKKDELFHGRSVILNKRLEAYTIRPDQRRDRDLPIERRGGGPGSLTVEESPQYLVQLWNFHGRVHSDSYLYEYQGWEEIDGHKCLRVQFAQPTHAFKARALYWIDMERGGHPLKVDYFHGSKLSRKLHSVRLDRVKALNGIDVWFPVRGELDGYAFSQSYYSSPLFHNTYAVVNGSLVVNQGLADTHFTLKHEVAAKTEALKNVIREFETTPMKRSDPLAVKRRLEEQLVEADRQAAALDASAAASLPWSGTMIFSGALGLLGIGSLALAVVWRVKRQ
jgi:hypothetical protein